MRRKYDLIVAEKPSQARTIAEVLGGKRMRSRTIGGVKVYIISTPWGKDAYVTSVAGHILDTDFESRFRNVSRSKVDPRLLLTKAKVQKIVRQGANKFIRVIRHLAKNADRLIIATDYDREGENIGRQIVRIAKSANPKIEVKRARFSAMTRDEILKAFSEENLKEINMNYVNASEARQESDLRVGASLTRLLSASVQRRLGATGYVISLGPVQTPTLGFVVERYLKHLESKEKAKEEYIIVADTDIGELVLQGYKRNDKSKAQEFIKNLPKVLELEREERKSKRKPRPLPLNTPRLAELSARYLGLSAKETLTLAESLYLEGFISYPRTETDKRNSESLKKAFKIARKVKELLKPSRDIGKPRNGRRDDQAHPPIHPVKVASPSSISHAKKRKLYEFILRHFLANFGPDAKLVEVNALFKGGEYKFSFSKTYAEDPGRLEVYPYINISERPVKVPKKLTVKAYRVKKLPPKIIPPITEAELVKLMDEHGVGTDATFADHINKLIERRYIERKGKYLIPTKLGLELYKRLLELDPEIVKPDIRAYMEQRFKLVESGKLSKEEAVKQNIERFLSVYDKIAKNIGKLSGNLARLALEMGKNVKSKKKGRRRRKKRYLFSFSLSNVSSSVRYGPFLYNGRQE